MFQRIQLAGGLSKVEADGDLLRFEAAAALSGDGKDEQITADAWRAAVPDYMMFGRGALRDGANAAGAVEKVEVGDDEIRLTGIVVDAAACAKVSTQFFKGIRPEVTVKSRCGGVISAIDWRLSHLTASTGGRNFSVTLAKADGAAAQDDTTLSPAEIDQLLAAMTPSKRVEFITTQLAFGLGDHMAKSLLSTAKPLNAPFLAEATPRTTGSAVKDAAGITTEQVTAYLATLSGEEQAKLLIQAQIITGSARKRY